MLFESQDFIELVIFPRKILVMEMNDITSRIFSLQKYLNFIQIYLILLCLQGLFYFKKKYGLGHRRPKNHASATTYLPKASFPNNNLRGHHSYVVSV